MKKEFIVARIEASQDSNPYVYVTFNDPKEYKPGEKQQNPGPNAMAFSSLDDLMKNMPKVMSNLSGIMGGGRVNDAPTMKMSIREYENIGIKVGDRVMIEIQRSDSVEI